MTEDLLPAEAGEVFPTLIIDLVRIGIYVIRQLDLRLDHTQEGVRVSFRLVFGLSRIENVVGSGCYQLHEVRAGPERFERLESRHWALLVKGVGGLSTGRL